MSTQNAEFILQLLIIVFIFHMDNYKPSFVTLYFGNAFDELFLYSRNSIEQMNFSVCVYGLLCVHACMCALNCLREQKY